QPRHLRPLALMSRILFGSPIHSDEAIAPLIEWSTVGDSDWTNVGTPTRTAAATTVNGIPLDLIGDNDGAATEYTFRRMYFTKNGDKIIDVLVKRSSA